MAGDVRFLPVVSDGVTLKSNTGVGSVIPRGAHSDIDPPSSEHAELELQADRPNSRTRVMDTEPNRGGRASRLPGHRLPGGLRVWQRRGGGQKLYDE
jgi:hypothetical protein